MTVWNDFSSDLAKNKGISPTDHIDFFDTSNFFLNIYSCFGSRVRAGEMGDFRSWIKSLNLIDFI